MGKYLGKASSVAEPKLFISGSSSTIYCHLKLFYNSRTILIEVEISFSSS